MRQVRHTASVHYRYPRLCIFMLLILSSISGLSYGADHTDALIATFQQSHKYRSVQLKLTPLVSPTDKKRGLAGVSEIPPGTGLLLESNPHQDTRIWMKGMLISIDIIFVSAAGYVLATVESVAPCVAGEPCSVYSAANVRYVIETRPGFVHKHQIDSKTRVMIPNLLPGRH
ncbi:DUF192 domain-containing protein [Amphritea sp. HPY]|uniref:DUF192 domain-containing protein n=1 Tax=Amphritea sp. HPY TaxID=3421652 RepID=UPI003D7C9A3E